MIKFGFEREAFCIGPEGTPILVPGDLPLDECGWLVEVRSEPHTCITKAVYLLEAETTMLKVKAIEQNCSLLFTPLMEISRNLKVAAARRHGKGLLHYKNLYGHEFHRNGTKFATASLHISFTNELEFHYATSNNDRSDNRNQIFKYQGFIDHAKLIVGLDKAFKDEIKGAKRNPGFYEVKPDGRIEYRSLPNDVDMGKVIQVLDDLFNGVDVDE